MPEYRQLSPGEPAPWFQQRTRANPKYLFDTVGGRYVLLCFYGTAGDAAGQAAIGFPEQHRSLFDGRRVSFFGVSTDPEDEATGRVQESYPGIRHFWDFDGLVSRLYGALPLREAGPFRRMWMLLNPGMQVLSILSMKADGSDRTALEKILAGLPQLSHYAGVEMHAPVILIPHVFSPDLCRRLIEGYGAHGGEPTGFMRDVAGKTVHLHDPGHKLRSDWIIEEEALQLELQTQFLRKVVPMIKKACAFDATRMERYLVGCYDSATGGHFSPHRDNTTRGTAHRRFAVSVNLNADFEGGELCFPEYGTRLYKMPPGCALVFSGTLLHAVTPVRSGQRYAFLPFVYDDAAAAVREANDPHLSAELGGYKAAPPNPVRT